MSILQRLILLYVLRQFSLLIVQVGEGQLLLPEFFFTEFDSFAGRLRHSG